jgi:hypothetical protein
VTSLEAYRVEFVEPLTEYPGTENEKGDIKKLPSAPNKSKIKFINYAKKKPLSQPAALHSPTLSGGQFNSHMMVHQIAEKLTVTDIQDSSAKKYSDSQEGVQGSGVSEAITQLTANIKPKS